MENQPKKFVERKIQMERMLTSFSIKYLTERYSNGKLNFDFAIQRDSGQWNAEQKSLLIHSVVSDMIVPTVYLVKEETTEGEIWTAIDGKQRLTTLMTFANDGFKLGNKTPNVIVNGKEYKIAGLKYSELPKAIKEKFDLYSLDVAFLFNYTLDTMEDQFYRLNNGSTFTKQQKAVVKLGTELAEKLVPFEQHPFWDITNISSVQKRHGVVMETILKSLMLLTDYNYQQFGAAEVVKFSSYYSHNYKQQTITYFGELLDKLNKYVLDDDEINEVLKPINIPIFIMNLDHFESLSRNSDKYEAFISWWCKEGIHSADYQKFCGSGSTNRAKVWGRMETMERCLDDFLNGKSSTISDAAQIYA